MLKCYASLAQARRIVIRCLRDRALDRLYHAGDRLSSHQTKHDKGHALSVLKTAQIIVRILKARGYKLTEWETLVIIPLAAYLHDIGRAINVADHATAGAVWAREYLSKLTAGEGDNETLPPDVIERICRVIACHRSETVLRETIDDAAWAIVVIADKCVGDEERVRPIRAKILAVLTWFRLSWIPLRRGGVHDRVNFAIKEAKLAGEQDDLVLKIALDRRVCGPELVYRTYSERFSACSKAANFLGLKFRLSFNARMFPIPGDSDAK